MTVFDLTGKVGLGSDASLSCIRVAVATLAVKKKKSVNKLISHCVCVCVRLEFDINFSFLKGHSVCLCVLSLLSV